MKWWMVNYRKSSNLILTVLLISILIFTSGCSLFPTEEAEEEIPVINPPQVSKKPEYPVKRGKIEIKVKGTGKVFSNQEEYLYFRGSDESKDNSGAENFRIKKIYVQPGDMVSAGDVLAELETKDLDLEIQRSETDLRIAEAQLIQVLRQEATTDEESLQQERAKADFRKIQIEHEKLVRKMQNSQIIAPFSGQIMNMFYESGDQVKAYDAVFLLANTSDLLVGIRVNSNDQKLLTLGMDAIVEVSGVKDPIKGKIIQIPNSNDNNSGRDYYGRIRMDEKKEHVLISVGKLPETVVRGTSAGGSIVIREKDNVLKIPLSALRTFSGRNYVVVADKDGKREVDVELGLQSATEVEIVSGLTEGQTVLGR